MKRNIQFGSSREKILREIKKEKIPDKVDKEFVSDLIKLSLLR